MHNELFISMDAQRIHECKREIGDIEIEESFKNYLQRDEKGRVWESNMVL